MLSSCKNLCPDRYFFSRTIHRDLTPLITEEETTDNEEEKEEGSGIVEFGFCRYGSSSLLLLFISLLLFWNIVLPTCENILVSDGL